MAIAGKLIGALIGSIAGPFGTLFGGMIGHLFDRAIEEREGPTPRLRGNRTVLSDPVSQAQINFLACLVGLSIAVAETGGRVTQRHVDALKDFFRANIPFTRDDQDLIQRLIDEMYLNRARIDIAGMCVYYRSVSNREGRILLIQLLFQTARANGGGVSAREEDLIRRIAANLGLEDWTYGRVRAAYAGSGSRAFEILGVRSDASVEEIKQAYRRLTVENHPDRVANLGPELVKLAEEKFKAIQEAYEEARRVKGF